ncbi:hypothetical protein BY458DRAFT_555710 [Sporodiniella umbellata]|nr:hypothetical protein BY458DRAFT_555710 [Sporodiniella umbellata]
MPVPSEQLSSLRRMSTLNIPKQDINFDTYDFQLCNPQNDIKDAFESKDLEASFCRDFACCGLVLDDLHELLQHYEECHVCLDDDDSSMFDSETDSWSSLSYSPIEDSFPVDFGEPKIECIDALKKKTNACLSDFYKSGSCSLSDDDEGDDPKKMVGKKRSFGQMNGTNALELLTQSAIKKLASISPFGNHSETNAALINDESFLAQAGALLASANSSSQADKPYKCPVVGCDKAYKNPNGLKYHNQHGHCSLSDSDNESIASKPYQCTIGDCGKRYKNLNGLKYHIEHSHMAALSQTLATFGSSLFSSPAPLPEAMDSNSYSPMLGAEPITFNIENPSIAPLI